jgi:hypothetical protein
MRETFFWGGWFTALATTTLLFLWSLSFSPFKHPGQTANEAAIIFFPVMILRWLAIACTIALVAIAWAQQMNLATYSLIGLMIAVLALHLILGLINIAIMNAWLSVEPVRTRSTNAIYVGIYFGLPVLWMFLTACLANIFNL